MKTGILAITMAAILTVLSGPATLCAQENASAGKQPGQKTAVLLVNHGSRSPTWRQALLDLERKVRPAILSNSEIQEVKTAFMEYTEPSIATRLKELDREGFTDVVMVPIFLTVSSHTFDDIPTIIGQKTDPQSLETMRLEKIERYQPKARVRIAPNLDFGGVLKTNVLRRVRALSKTPAREGLVLIAYGDATYEREWSQLLNEVGEFVKTNAGIDTFSFGWCGHVVHYDSKKTTEAVDRVLKTKAQALVVPVLVAMDENFQIKIIGGGIASVENGASRVVYKPDAILPEPSVEQWVIRISQKLAANDAQRLSQR